MVLTLSWRRKLQVLVVVTLIGLVLLTLSALRGLDEVTDSYNARGGATAFERTSLSLLLQWLRVEGHSKNLLSSRLPAYETELNGLNDTAAQLVQLSAGLNDAGIEGSARVIKGRVEEYISLRKDWLTLLLNLGLNDDEGLRARLDQVINDGLRNIGLSIMDDDINQAIAGLRELLVSQRPAAADMAFEAINNIRGLVEQMGWEENDIGESVQRFSAGFNLAHDLVQKINAIEARLLATGGALEDAIEKQNQSLQSGLIAATTDNAADGREASTWRILVTAAVVITVLVLTLIKVSRTLVSRLRDTVRLLSQVATGDLSNRLEIGENSRDEFNDLGKATNQMMDDISSVIRQIIDGNKDLNALQGELQGLMGRMTHNSEHVEEQAEQTAAAVQEISHTASEIASRTATVNQSAQRADESAKAGSRVIKTSVDNIHSLSLKIQKTHEQAAQLSETGGKVNRIVDVINSLAEQTNLLALNAAIEAARAGEAGRGFSVVADEVRSLAEKTVSATSGVADIVSSLNHETQEISQLMEQGLEEASKSEKTAGEAATAIDEITRSVGSLAADLDQVLSSVKGISTTTDEIAHKVEQIHVSTMETRTVRTQLEDHTQSLSRQASSLNDISGRFHL